MSKEFTIHIQAGCRIAGYISDKSRNRSVAEVFDVLEVKSDGQFRCHIVGAHFGREHNRSVFLYEHQLSWCRLPDGREFFRKSPEEKWQDIKLLA
ncbi:MAG: hypothetical protein GX776_05565 [Oxalobacter sp.]|nr:hypothetical protein [Oxalobacter sp.]